MEKDLLYELKIFISQNESCEGGAKTFLLLFLEAAASFRELFVCTKGFCVYRLYVSLRAAHPNRGIGFYPLGREKRTQLILCCYNAAAFGLKEKYLLKDIQENVVNC